MKKIKVTTMGGGTGSFTILSGIKKFDHVDLAAIVSMADDGGSTGRLRDELGVLPAGDIRQCLVALSEAPEDLRYLFNYRFENGGLGGHSFGNIFISALEKIHGNLSDALIFLKKILKIRGDVIPITLNDIKLIAELDTGAIIFGEHQINSSPTLKNQKIKGVFLNNRAQINPSARERILSSDYIIIGPGNLYCSLIPLFLVDGVIEALKKTHAKIIYVANLMTKYSHSDDFSIFDFVKKIEEYSYPEIFNFVIYNNKRPSETMLKRYSSEGSYTTFPDRNSPFKQGRTTYIGAPLLKNHVLKKNNTDNVTRSFIRHNPGAISVILRKIIHP